MADVGDGAVPRDGEAVPAVRQCVAPVVSNTLDIGHIDEIAVTGPMAVTDHIVCHWSHRCH